MPKAPDRVSENSPLMSSSSGRREFYPQPQRQGKKVEGALTGMQDRRGAPERMMRPKAPGSSAGEEEGGGGDHTLAPDKQSTQVTHKDRTAARPQMKLKVVMATKTGGWALVLTEFTKLK